MPHHGLGEFEQVVLSSRRPSRPPPFTSIVAPLVAMGRAGGDSPLQPWRGDNVVTTADLRFTFAGGIVTPIGGVPLPFGGVGSFSLGARIR